MQHMFFNPRQGVVSVKQGFSWPAALFGSLWAIAHHMWVPCALVMLSIEALLWFGAGYAQAHANDPLAMTVWLASLIFVVVRGRYGNAWLSASLRSRGYSERGDLLLVA